WLASKSWEKFWPKIGWKTGNNWTRYPDGFTWNLTAPRGHLPLSNQLRGVRVIASLLSHPAWSQEGRRETTF
ncbi:MAG: GUN4 domain-containing protein, partial [Chroococcidiopsidaceae cyanobacterium CP_BM_ER_R8_30]|nr:GUN4 domain-containing protein [Chroococcidiopsidaceae cyanobacterium CP_BM_ER_R8_30]